MAKEEEEEKESTITLMVGLGSFLVPNKLPIPLLPSSPGRTSVIGKAILLPIYKIFNSFDLLARTSFVVIPMRLVLNKSSLGEEGSRRHLLTIRVSSLIKVG